MPLTPSTEEEFKNVSEFTNMYNKWYKELVSIEDNLLLKANEIQSLQSSLNTDTEMLRHLNDSVMSTQIEQNYIEDLLNVLSKEQVELENEIQKLEENVNVSGKSSKEDFEDCSNTLEFLDAELKQVKDNVKNLVNKINSNKDRSNVTENPFPIYRTILDHYADALNLLNKNTSNIQQKFNELDDICLQQCIPPGLFTSPM